MGCIHKVIFYQKNQKMLLVACFIFRAINIERLTSNFSQNAMNLDALKSCTGCILIKMRRIWGISPAPWYWHKAQKWAGGGGGGGGGRRREINVIDTSLEEFHTMCWVQAAEGWNPRPQNGGMLKRTSCTCSNISIDTTYELQDHSSCNLKNT